jgi:hypothetical protein
MSVIESKANVDIVWTDEKPDKRPTHLIVYYQQEHGYGTALAGKALIGKQEPIAKIYSNLMNVNAINYIPAPFWPEYRLYEVYNNNDERFFILRIPSLHPVNVSANPNANPMVWLHTYPIVRDIVMLLNDTGVNRMTYLTSNLFRLHKDFTDFGEVGHGNIVEYDYISLANEVEKRGGSMALECQEDFVIAPNVWIWCDIFATFCGNSPFFSEVILGAVGSDFLDADTADTFLNRLHEKYGLNYDEEALEELTSKLTQMKNYTYINMDDALKNSQDFNKDDFNTDSTDDGDFTP